MVYSHTEIDDEALIVEVSPKHYIKDSDYGSPTQEKVPIYYDPSQYDTCETAAEAFYKALRNTVTLYGQNPDTECGIFTPDQAAEREYGHTWVVWWEAGPFEWGIVASGEFMFNREAGWFTEPYFSFDLTFTE
jgi:hypothetical protein